MGVILSIHGAFDIIIMSKRTFGDFDAQERFAKQLRKTKMLKLSSSL